MEYSQFSIEKAKQKIIYPNMAFFIRYVQGAERDTRREQRLKLDPV